jgi:hypothetical protein
MYFSHVRHSNVSPDWLAHMNLYGIRLPTHVLILALFLLQPSQRTVIIAYGIQSLTDVGLTGAQTTRQKRLSQ